MNFHLDPHRPHIDGSTIRCPGCGQTYDVIVNGWVRLPPHHYPQPTGTRHGIVVGRDASATGEGLCPVDGDVLVAHLFRAQVAAEREQRGAA